MDPSHLTGGDAVNTMPNASQKKQFQRWMGKNGNNLYPTRNDKENLATFLGTSLDQASRLLANHRRKQLKNRKFKSSQSVSSPAQNNKENIGDCRGELQMCNDSISINSSPLINHPVELRFHPLENGQHKEPFVTPPPSTLPMELLPSPLLNGYHVFPSDMPNHTAMNGYVQSQNLQCLQFIPQNFADEQERIKQLAAVIQHHRNQALFQQQQQALIGLIAAEAQKNGVNPMFHAAQSGFDVSQAAAMHAAIQRELQILYQRQHLQQIIATSAARLHNGTMFAPNPGHCQQSPVLNFLSPPLTQTPSSPCTELGITPIPITHRIDQSEGELDAIERKIAVEHSGLSASESIAVAVLASGLSSI